MKKYLLSVLFIVTFLFGKKELTSNIIWDIHQHQYSLQKCPLINSETISNVIISCPTPEGGRKEFIMYKSPVMPKILSDNYPNIQTYTGIGKHDISERISLTINNIYINSMILSPDGNIFITQNNDSNIFRVSYNEQITPLDNYDCGNIGMKKMLNRLDDFDECIGENTPCYRMGDKLITYRIAMIMTEAVTNSVADGTVEGGIAWIASMVNKLNLLWRRELGFQFVLIPNNDILVFTTNNPAPGEFSVNNCTETSDGDPKYCEINNVEPYLESVIGIGGLNAPDETRLWEYGLVLNTTYNGGLAQAPGPISANNPTYEVLNHELGHNLGSAHNITIENGYRSSLGGSIMGSRTRTIPGSKGDQYTLHTIEIGYKNYNTLRNDPNYPDAYAYLNGYTSSETNNMIPELSIPESGFLIPKETPFVLEGTSVPHNDNYLFSWEQNDISSTSFCMDLTNTSDECSGLSSWPSNEGPLFSTVDLTKHGNKRYFPSMISLLNNEYSTTFNDFGTILTVERLPFGERDINMRLQVRTNEVAGGAVNFKNLKFSVDGNSGPFRLTSQSDSINWLVESNQTITWDVANTNIAPINCSTIDILLSVNAGRDFNKILAEFVPNDGSHEIIVPQISSSDSCRLMIKASDNIFFDINNSNFSITNSKVPSILLNQNEITLEFTPNGKLYTDLILTNDGEIGSVLSYELNFIDSIYFDESFEGLDLDATVNNVEYVLPQNWNRSSEGRGWIIGTEEISAFEDWIISQVGDMYFDIPTWANGNYAYTDDDQYSVCPTCSPYTGTDCDPNCGNGSLDYLITPSIFIPSNSNAFLSFYSFGLEGDNHSNILQISSENVWSDIESLSHSTNYFSLMEYDLSSFSGKEIKIRFHSKSNEPGPGEGWAIDNIRLHTSPSWLSSADKAGDLISEKSIAIPLLIDTENLQVGKTYTSKIILNDFISNLTKTIKISLNIIDGVAGCMDQDACNFNSNANIDDGSCSNCYMQDCINYPIEDYDCEGNILDVEFDILPKDYTIKSIYPNPFNPKTQITYSVPKYSLVNILVYDLKGKIVATLISSYQNSGYHSIEWDASLNASGIYFVKLESSDKIDIQRLMLIK